MKKKKNLYYPTKEIKKRALIKSKSIYKEAGKSPVKFWAKAARDLIWQKKWKKVFEHNPPYFKWFLGGKINITQNILDRNVKERKNKVAFFWEPEPIKEKKISLTFYELSRKVNRFANALLKIGVKKGDRVGIYLPMIPEAIISMLACARIGAVHCIVFSAFSDRALRERLKITGAKVLITADGYWRRGKEINLKVKADQGIEETKIKKVIVVKRLGNKIAMKKGKDFWWDELVRNESYWCAPAEMDSEDLLFILPESGTGGEFIPISHVCGGYTVQAYLTAKWVFDLQEDDVFWSAADIGWITGHTYSCYGPLLNGTTFVLFEGAPDWPTPERWCQIVEKYGVTTFYIAPTAIRMFKRYDGQIVKKYDFKELQILGSVGEPINESSWKWYFEEVGGGKCPLVDTWWQTETGGILITSLPGVGPFKPTFTGLPFPGIKVDILDDKGMSQPEGKAGNLVVLPPFAPGMMRGVYGNPKKYLETYWSRYGKKIYFTSDSAYKDKNGLIRIVGRVDDVIKIAGHRLTTGELENAIVRYEKINECAVIGVPDKIKGEAPVVFAVLKRGKPSKIIEKELVEGIRKGISPIAVPKAVYFVKDLPKTRSGKIMRKVLKRLFIGESLGDISSMANPESLKEIKRII